MNPSTSLPSPRRSASSRPPPVSPAWHKQRQRARAEVLAEAVVACLPVERRDFGLLAMVQLYELGDWAQAFDAAVQGADRGSAAAAKLALLMLRHGMSLYGVALRAEPTQVARWARQVLGRAGQGGPERAGSKLRVRLSPGD